MAFMFKWVGDEAVTFDGVAMVTKNLKEARGGIAAVPENALVGAFALRAPRARARVDVIKF